MTAVERLASRLSERIGSAPAREVAAFIYDDYLPEQIIGMKRAAELLGLPTSNTLTMRLARGHDLTIVAHIDGNRITTVDAVEAYAEIHPKPPAVGDDGTEQEAS